MIDLQASAIRAFIPAQDFDVSKAFYQALGFAVEWADDNLAVLANGGQHFYLQRYYVKEWADNCMLHISVADAQACYDGISQVLADGSFPGARVAAPKQEPYGALVTYVWDPAGVLLHLAQWTR
jgi:predicted lactoylglutathione lyase